MRILSILLCLFPFVGMAAQETYSVASPDSNFVFSFTQNRGKMTYSVKFNDKEIVRPSEMGVEIDNRLFESALAVPHDSCRHWCENLTLSGTERSSVDTTWTPVYGENSTVRDRYNQLTLHFVKGAKSGDTSDGYDKRKFYMMDIHIRAYNEGVAFRYHFPEASNGLFIHITGETTQFTMPEGTMAWHTEWAQAEHHLTALKDWRHESERPLLMRTADGTYIALLEAAMTDYARGKFRLAADNTLQVSMYGCADIITPYSTPWRVVMAGERAVDLINNKDIVLNLNEPCRIVDTSFIRPGKAFRSGKLEKSAIMEGIDFAKRMGLQYVELDAGWYGPEMKVASDALRTASNRNFTMPEICDYARRQGIGVWVYVNQRALYRQLDDILPLYKQWGIAGIKFGFVQIGNQMWTTWLHDTVRKCAEYGIMVDIHDEYRPTGFSRTYPNLLTQEGIRGNEEMPAADHNVTLPFTRLLCGAADYTPCYFNSRVKNTKCHQLAMAAVYYSPLTFLFWYDNPNVDKGEEELKFWHDIPTMWDESRAIAGEPGEYIVQTRRSGDRWFIGAMNGMEPRKVTIDTRDFLSPGDKRKYTAEIYTDDPELNTRTNVRKTVRKIKYGDKITVEMPASGGAAVEISIAATAPTVTIHQSIPISSKKPLGI